MTAILTQLFWSSEPQNKSRTWLTELVSSFVPRVFTSHPNHAVTSRLSHCGQQYRQVPEHFLPLDSSLASLPTQQSFLTPVPTVLSFLEITTPTILPLYHESLLCWVFPRAFS